MALTGKRRAFIEYYLECWNGTEAARRAGYKYPRRQASFLLSISVIQAAIDARLAEMAMPADEVLARLGDHARTNIADFVTDTGAIDWQAVQEKGHLIKRITHRKGQQSVIELHDAQAALIHLDKHHGGPGGDAIPERLIVHFTSNVDDDQL